MNKYQDAFEKASLCCLCTDTAEEAHEYLDVLKELVDKAAPKKSRGIKKDRCSICGSYNEIFSKRRNTVAHDIVYCWHCGNAIELE